MYHHEEDKNAMFILKNIKFLASKKIQKKDNLLS